MTSILCRTSHSLRVHLVNYDMYNNFGSSQRAQLLGCFFDFLFIQAHMASLIFSSDDWVKLPREKTDEVYYWKPWTGEICEKRDTHSIGACKDSSNQWYFWRLGSQETFWLLTSSASSSKDTNDFCFDVFKNQVLKDMANQKKLPNVAEMDREDLLESLRLSLIHI